MWLILFLAVAVTVIASHELTVGPRLQGAKVREAVAGFSCDDLTVETAGGSQLGSSLTMRSALRMPAACTSDLRRRIRGDPRFRPERCNLVERCWVRTEDGKRYVFTFHPTFTSFRFERS